MKVTDFERVAIVIPNKNGEFNCPKCGGLCKQFDCLICGRGWLEMPDTVKTVEDCHKVAEKAGL